MASFSNRSLATADGGTLLLSGNNVGGASVHYWADTTAPPMTGWRLGAALWADGHGLAELALLTELDGVLNARADEDHHNRMNQLLRAGAQNGWAGSAVLHAVAASSPGTAAGLPLCRQTEPAGHPPGQGTRCTPVRRRRRAPCSFRPTADKVQSLLCDVMTATNRLSGNS